MNEENQPAQSLTKRHFLNSPTLVGGLVTLAIAAIATTAFLLTGGSKAATKELERPVLPVEVMVAKPVNTVDYTRVFVGEIKAKRSSDLAFERSARIKSISVNNGDRVKAGDDLAELDTEDLLIAQRRAEATLNNAKQVLAELVEGPRQETIAAAKADVAAYLAEKELAEFIYNKRAELFQRDAISAEELNQAKSRFEAAKARYVAADQKFLELDKGTRAERKAAQQELVKQLQAELDDVNLNITRSTLKAPYSGSISMRYLDEGTVVAPGSPVLRITEDHKLEAIVGLPPKMVKQIKVGSELDCIPDSEKANEPLPKATVTRILPETDQRTRMIPVVVELSHEEFKPGELVRIRLSETRNQSGVFVPTVALVPSANGLAAVFVVKGKPGDQKAVLTPVSKLFNDRQFTKGKFTLVEGTLNKGDLIISSGVQRITNGQNVTVLEPAPNANE